MEPECNAANDTKTTATADGGTLPPRAAECVELHRRIVEGREWGLHVAFHRALDELTPEDGRRLFAFAQSDADATSSNLVGICFGHGIGVPQDSARAAATYETLAKRGVATTTTTHRSPRPS